MKLGSVVQIDIGRGKFKSPSLFVCKTLAGSGSSLARPWRNITVQHNIAVRQSSKHITDKGKKQVDVGRSKSPASSHRQSVAKLEHG